MLHREMSKKKTGYFYEEEEEVMMVYQKVSEDDLQEMQSYVVEQSIVQLVVNNDLKKEEKEEELDELQEKKSLNYQLILDFSIVQVLLLSSDYLLELLLFVSNYKNMKERDTKTESSFSWISLI